MPIYKKKTINNTPTKIPLSAPQGYPVGTIIMRYKKICPRNCVYLDGRDTTGTAEELETVYPALYMFLGGTNVLPDYREVAPVGAEQNTTDSIASHDVYTEGEFKDDQIQNFNLKALGDTDHTTGSDYTLPMTGASTGNVLSEFVKNRTNARYGTTTHGKQKAVYYYMVAVEGCMIADEDDFINVIKNYIDTTQSYSTTETNTGKKWIDGKPIYEKTIIQNLEGVNPFIGRVDVTHGIANIQTPIRIVMAKAIIQGNDWSTGITIPAKYDNTTFAELGQFTQTTVSLYAGTTNLTSLNKVLFTLEYTKTT